MIEAMLHEQLTKKKIECNKLKHELDMVNQYLIRANLINEGLKGYETNDRTKRLILMKVFR